MKIFMQLKWENKSRKHMPSLVMEHDSAVSAKAAVQGCYQAQRLIQIGYSPQIRGKIKPLFVNQN